MTSLLVDTARSICLFHPGMGDGMSRCDSDDGLMISRFILVAGPIPLVKGGRVKAPQSPRYTTHERLLKAKNI